MLPTPESLAQARIDAARFFHEPITVINPVYSYDEYGTQTVTSGVVYTTSGYIGAVRGDDRELVRTIANVSSSANAISDGYISNHSAIVLLPATVALRDTYIIHARDTAWRVVWTNDRTMDSVKVYAKAVCITTTVADELNV